jgi:hypothetical protein
LLGRFSRKLRKSFAGANMVYSREERVHSRTLLFSDVRETFSNEYPDKEVPNKTIHRLVTKFRIQEMFATGNMSGVGLRLNFSVGISQRNNLFEYPTKLGGTETQY